MPSARRACCSASSDCPSRRFFRHSLKSFIPASEGDVVPIQWDIGSFLNPAGTSRVTGSRAPRRSAGGNRTSVQFLGSSLLLAHRTAKGFFQARSFRPGIRQRPTAPVSPCTYWSYLRFKIDPLCQNHCTSLCTAIGPRLAFSSASVPPSLLQLQLNYVAAGSVSSNRAASVL